MPSSKPKEYWQVKKAKILQKNLIVDCKAFTVGSGKNETLGCTQTE
jgi:hypothetical protein